MTITRRAALCAALIFAAPAAAHDWYPSACCNETDCSPVPVEDVQVVDGKYVVSWGGQTVAFDKANPSPDGQYHICTRGGRLDGALITLKAKRPHLETIMPTSNACFWAPVGM